MNIRCATAGVLTLMLCSCFEPKDEPIITQLDMNVAAHKELERANSEMRELLLALEKKADGRSDSIAKLREAQRAWEIYCEAHINAWWTHQHDDDRKFRYGSVFPWARSSMKEGLVRSRIEQLKSMLHPEEGDLTGSHWPD